MTNIYQAKIEALERELAEMTSALSQAWDQLVPFLQSAPPQAETIHELQPILHAVTTATDTEQAGIYLFDTQEWFTIPEALVLTHALQEQLNVLQQETILEDVGSRWLFAPIRSIQKIIGVLGVGTQKLSHSFSAVDVRIVMRMAERAGSQLSATQLARSREREAITQRELHIASQIQSSIQPKKSPQLACFNIASYWQPARQVGGDAWGWVMQDNGHLAWFILDVAGKGLPAALAAVSLHTAIRLALRMSLTPAEVLKRINTEFYDAYTMTDLMATVTVLTLDPAKGVLQLANAGHPPTFIRHNKHWQRIPASVPPIGVLPDFVPETTILQLKPHDLIVCYSDGFTEIQMKNAQLWGEDGLLGIIPLGARDADALTQLIVAASRHAGTIEDDQTLVIATYTGSK